MVALLFPGQGSQKVGMGKALAEAYPVARQTFEEADAALGFALSAVCFEGPEEALKRTEHTQPALLTVGIALWRVLSQLRPGLKLEAAAGHSLGEWTALVAVGALDFADAVRAVRERGRLMQEAVPVGMGAMKAVLGLDAEKIRAICAEVEAGAGGELVRPANFNTQEQTVISGHTGAVEQAAVALKAAKAMKLVDLPVSAPFHCPLMQPAADGLARTIEGLVVRPLACPVVTNVEATPNADPARVKALLIQQITAPVRWVEVTQALVALGVTDGVELGPGKVLAGMVKRIDKSLRVLSAEDPDTLAKLVEALPA
jgi:[acyl-carrier-protein] S-malonyltransferase